MGLHSPEPFCQLLQKLPGKNAMQTIVTMGMVSSETTKANGRSHSSGKLPRSGGIGLADICLPPGPPKLIFIFVAYRVVEFIEQRLRECPRTKVPLLGFSRGYGLLSRGI